MLRTFSGLSLPDESAALLRETHRARLAGEFPRSIDLGRYFHQRRLVP